jgi:pimeloyl-ACP methyl ester carboxylesterase
MTSFVLIPGAGTKAGVWDRVVAELEARGHEGLAIELPWDDESAGLPQHLAATLAAIGDRDDLVIVAQSLGGFTGPAVAARVPARLLVMLSPMIPAPGETAGAWWENTDHAAAIEEIVARRGPISEWDMDGIEEVFLNGLSPEAKQEAAANSGAPPAAVFGSPCLIDSWPDVPTRVLIGRDDRFFPLEFARRIARERLGIEPDEMDGGHLLMLGHAEELARRLVEYNDHL